MLGDWRQPAQKSDFYLVLAISDVNPIATKCIRLFNAFAGGQNLSQSRLHILAFIRKSIKPEHYVSNPGRFNPMRVRLNLALLFAGLAVDQSGTLHEVTQTRTRDPA